MFNRVTTQLTANWLYSGCIATVYTQVKLLSVSHFAVKLLTGCNYLWNILLVLSGRPAAVVGCATSTLL